jgi:thioredoxin-dependent peroxiredoxin
MKKILLLTLILMSYSLFASHLKSGDDAPEFKLQSLTESELSLTQLNKDKKVILVVLRGWVGKQCPICSRQVGDYMKNYEDLKDSNVVFIYPGPSDKLKTHAEEFRKNAKDLPKNFHFLIDPEYKMVNAYKIRWKAAKQTAYPSTFIVENGKITFAEVSKNVRGRVSVQKLKEHLH